MSNERQDAIRDQVLEDFRAAAQRLESAARGIREEAGWIERNYPLTEWSAETADSYLASSRASREYEVRQRTAEALKFIGRDDLLDEVIDALSRGYVR